MTELEQLCYDCKSLREDWEFGDDGEIIRKCDRCPLSQEEESECSK